MRRSILPLFLLVCSPLPGQNSQDQAPTRSPKETSEKQEPLVVTATRSGKRAFDLPQAGNSLDRDTLLFDLQARTLPEALREIPGISVQKTGPAQGSPKIRGQNGFRTLFLIDGIRLNNSVWRSGNVEYWNTVDVYGLRRLEIVRGPSSVLWGSDGVFGTGQGFSIGPGDPSQWKEGFRTRQRLLFRHASAEESFVERIETQGNQGTGFGWHLGVTYKDYGTWTAGQEVGSLPYTGYQEFDGDYKFVLPLGGGDRLILAGQHVDQKKGPRTHSTVFAKSWRGTTAGSDFSRDIDQKRDLVYIGWRRGGTWDDAETALTASYQRFEEEENRVRSNSRRRIQGDTVDQFGLQGRHRMRLGEGTLTFGFEAYHEGVDSFYRELNPDQSLRSTRPRGPVADEAVYDQLALFGLYEHPLGEDLVGSLGLRYQYVEADADVVDIPGVSGGPFAPVHRSWNQFVGQASLVWKPEDRVRVFGNLAQSFRAPNLSDLTRFDVALSGDLEIPSTDVDPEKFLTLEGGVRYDDGLRRLSFTAFHTWAKDLIQRKPTGNIVGGLTEVTKTNASDGYFVGFEAEGATNLDFVGLDNFEFYSYVDFVSSLIDATDPSDPRRVRPKGLPPIKGQFGIRFLDLVNERLTAELFFPWSAGLSASEYNAAERRNTQRIPPDGLPAYLLVGIRGSYKINDRMRASLSIENIENRDYRILDSGLNEAGTNVIFTFEARF